ncbi:glycoside hydrolase family 32 protein [Kocuria sp. NPDC057446]|uniref:glycoside hydrolase family 32 protein n=1 Tax=Kocuria sp. NPDC057446 TaxID=3346137 RepID=UPI003687B56A
MTLTPATTSAVLPLSRAFPRTHPRPDRGWLNDPNGLCRVDGTWHVFFQYNPGSARHDAIQWGHLSSPDLVTWQEEPVALRPQEHGPDAFGCWSGVVTVDEGRPVAVYSGVEAADDRSRVTLATGTDDLRSWRQDGATAAEMPADPDVVAVRDPFLFRWAGRRYALQGAGLADGRAAILLYDAADLADWSYLGVWLTSDHPVLSEDLDASIWECPQLVELTEGERSRWVLIVSRWMRQEDGSGRLQDVRYVVGRMDGRADDDGSGARADAPRFIPEACGAVDTGPAFYAPQVLALEDRALLWGWSWETRSAELSDEEGWAGLLTWPRELRLDGDVLVAAPAAECAGHRSRPLELTPVHGAVELPDAAELRATGEDAAVRLLLRGPAGEREVWAGRASTVVVDGSVVELYAHAGPPHTLRAYPQDGETWCAAVEPGTVSGWALGPSTP